MIKKISLDTNADFYNEESNFYLVIVNNETNISTTEYPAFREIMDGVNPTGVYFCEVDLEIGNYHITVKHNSIEKDGVVHVVIKEDEHLELENKIMGIVKDTDDGVAFA